MCVRCTTGELEPSELLQKLLEAMLVNNMLTQDMLLVLESVDYRLAKGQMQVGMLGAPEVSAIS